MPGTLAVSCAAKSMANWVMFAPPSLPIVAKKLTFFGGGVRTHASCTAEESGSVLELKVGGRTTGSGGTTALPVDPRSFGGFGMMGGGAEPVDASAASSGY